MYNQVKFIHARKCKAILALNVNQGFIYMQEDAKKELILVYYAKNIRKIQILVY